MIGGEKRMNDKQHVDYSAICTASYSKTSVIKGECLFSFYLLKQIRVFNNKYNEVNVQITIM
jgi:hypothetical protein